MKPDATMTIRTETSAEDVRLEQNISFPEEFDHAILSQDDRYLVVSHPDKNKSSIIDFFTGSICTTQNAAIPDYAIASPDGKSVFVCDTENNTVSKLDARKWALCWIVGVGNAPKYMELSDRGDKLFVANSGDGTVSVISLPKGTVTDVIGLGEWFSPGFFRLRPDAPERGPLQG